MSNTLLMYELCDQIGNEYKYIVSNVDALHTMYIIILQVELLPDIQNAPRILPPYVQFIPANFKKVQCGSFTFTMTSQKCS